MTMTIDVISDVICPWCLVGKRRLEKAILSLNGRGQIQVRWQPFQLNPQMPKDGMARREYRIGKFGTWEQSLALDAKMTEIGASEGIAFNLDRIARTPNTLDSHRLIWLAEKHGVQDAVVEALFRAYFIEGRDISESKTLLDVVVEAGLVRDRAEKMLNSAEGVDALRMAEEKNRVIGVQGVPFFLVNDELAISGAQKPEVFVAAFDRLIAQKLMSSDGSVCAVGLEGKPEC